MDILRVVNQVVNGFENFAQKLRLSEVLNLQSKCLDFLLIVVFNYCFHSSTQDDYEQKSQNLFSLISLL